MSSVNPHHGVLKFSIKRERGETNDQDKERKYFLASWGFVELG